MMGEESLLVRKIDWGTVIDHIPAWRAGQVIRLLGIDHLMNNPEVSVIILNNVPSRKYGRKDIVKIYHYHISQGECDILSLIFPTTTINYIKDWRVEKVKPKIPDKIVGRIRCPEVTCITNKEREPVKPRFTVLRDYGVVQCEYCDSLLEFSKIPEYVIG
jgi:aspartate carbamoyltransferase regulatory subunit